MVRWSLIGCVALLAACAPAVDRFPGGEGGRAPSGEADTRPPAPWTGIPVAESAVPAVARTAWSRAENRESCALIVPGAPIPGGERAAPREANFAGGWAIAYDLPDLRNAFGVAGTGTDASGDGVYDEWPHAREWADGSRAGYGPEGGTGPNQLAYLRITGQGCLYNVWSRVGVEHLESLLESLRFVEPYPPSQP